jgi:hypothetical protein
MSAWTTPTLPRAPLPADEPVQPFIGSAIFEPRHARRAAQARPACEQSARAQNRGALCLPFEAADMTPEKVAKCGQPFRVEDSGRLAGASALAPFRTQALRLTDLISPHHAIGVAHA